MAERFGLLGPDLEAQEVQPHCILCSSLRIGVFWRPAVRKVPPGVQGLQRAVWGTALAHPPPRGLVGLYNMVRLCAI